MNKINLVPAPWATPITTQKELYAALHADSSAEFVVQDISSRWNGSTTTARELREQGVTHAQIRYGKNNAKVWYGKL